MRTVCIYHSRDLDGWMSAAIVKKWFLGNNHEGGVVHSFENNWERPTCMVNTPNELSMLGWDYGDEIPDLSEYDKVIMCDISFPKEEMVQIDLKSKDGLHWIDHHLSAIKANNFNSERDGKSHHVAGLRDTNFAACELTWKYFFPNKEMPEIVRLLGRYDCFGHKQQWKHVVGYEGLYEVSDQGNVRSLDRIIIEKNTGKKRYLKGKDLSIANSKRGYRVVVLCKEGVEKMKNVHQLVCEAFAPNPENKPCINHKDLNRLNNHLENLEWCTYEENNLHSIKFGSRGKAVLQLDDNGILENRFESIREAEEKTGIQHSNITAVCKGKREKAGRYKWEYAFNSPKKPQFVPQDEEQKVLEFQYGARQCISNYEEAYKYLVRSLNYNEYSDDMNIGTPEMQIWDKGESIYQYLCTEAKQIYKKAFKIELDENHVLNEENGSVNTIIRNFLCVNQERFNPINFGIDYHKEGYDGFACFWYKDSKWMWSLYNDNGEVDCSAIANQYGGGGHKGAAGFVCDNETMLKIIRDES
jgi:oligoribonuclease NrnB/cAMP/cGMP phosphodiesterase (DHH superfamily)